MNYPLSLLGYSRGLRPRSLVFFLLGLLLLNWGALVSSSNSLGILFYTLPLSSEIRIVGRIFTLLKLVGRTFALGIDL